MTYPLRSVLLIALGSIPLLQAANWTGWKPDPTFPGIEVRARCTGFNEFANRYLWDVQLRNTYHKDVDLTWAAQPELLRGSQAQSDRAFAVKPGEVVGAHHTAPADCGSGLLVKVDDVKTSGSTATSADRPTTTTAHAIEPKIGGHWRSKDPEPYQKELDVQLSGRTVTSTF